nr:hypothetical protein Iba_chr03fCG2150 [Ipomoea batatas]GMC94423.1 hypothetical protein Iba_chr05bCG11570 [Ipomoea batatas]GMD49122.1 hypothetical protein Iba_chr11aCG0710 [Ipomoea batatas]GMD84887.1 hypothetical protein Iba_chr14aCG19010 [Ipomoea batatas]
MPLGKGPLITLNVQKHHQIEHIHADGINLGGIGGGEGIRFGVQDGSNGFEHKARVARRDLKRLGNGLRVDTGLHAVGEDELRNWEKAVLELLLTLFFFILLESQSAEDLIGNHGGTDT